MFKWLLCGGLFSKLISSSGFGWCSLKTLSHQNATADFDDWPVNLLSYLVLSPPCAGLQATHLLHSSMSIASSSISSCDIFRHLKSSLMVSGQFLHYPTLLLLLQNSRTSLVWFFYLYPYKKLAPSASIFSVFYIFLSHPVAYSFIWYLVVPWYM